MAVPPHLFSVMMAPVLLKFSKKIHAWTEPKPEKIAGQKGKVLSN